MVNLTGLSDCKALYEISVTALNCAGNASGTIWSQLLFPPGPPKITTLSMGEGWMTVAITQSINGGAPSLFIVTINNSTMSINVNAINGTAMVNLTGLSNCKAPYEISVIALNCAGNASGTIWSQLLCQAFLSVPPGEGIPSTLIPTPTLYSSEHDKLSPINLVIASATTAVIILLFVILAMITLIAAYLRYMSRASTLNHLQTTANVVYEEVTFSVLLSHFHQQLVILEPW